MLTIFVSIVLFIIFIIKWTKYSRFQDSPTLLAEIFLLLLFLFNIIKAIVDSSQSINDNLQNDGIEEATKRDKQNLLITCRWNFIGQK